MPDLDCYLFIDSSTEESASRMSVMCVECHDEKMPDVGSYYAGSVEGYSPYEWKCDLCGKTIHEVNDDDSEKPEAAS